MRQPLRRRGACAPESQEMRLTEGQRSAICSAAREVFGEAVQVWLFGSRVDDTLRGGDIDLLIETRMVDVDAIVRAELMFMAKLENALGEQKIDVLVDYPTRNARPTIFAIAKQTGILL